MSNKRAILLTGTIIPNSIYTSYNDPLVRLKEYLSAIKFYKEQFKNDDIYFLENSEFDLDQNSDYLKLKQEIPFEVIRSPKSEKFNEGKGYQEFEMVDKAIDLLKAKYHSFIKITGRYLVSNAFAITDFECKGLVIDLNKREKKALTYFMYFTSEFYTHYLKGEYKNVNDNGGVFIEHVIYKKIIQNNLLSYCQLFHRTPLLTGITGSYGFAIKRNKFRVLIRNCERFVYGIFSVKQFFY